tara:strand:+ start:273 stop:905 length:633 start_codon:yes stop_codon:yes gene_type:complete
MISKRIQEKGILAKLLEKGIKILLEKECKEIGRIKINIIASSIDIIKGIIQKINIIAIDVNYKDLFFDEIKLEANDVKIIFKIKSKEFKFNKDFIIKFKISLSESSLKTILLSSNWNWVGDMISKEILNQEKLEDINIQNDQILIKELKENKDINDVEKLSIRVEQGKLYLGSKYYNKYIKVPIEDKVFIEDINIQNNLINISANTSIDF